jgi:hypothetical protein
MGSPAVSSNRTASSGESVSRRRGVSQSVVVEQSSRARVRQLSRVSRLGSGLNLSLL